jgi:putative FmdB family regulatory protein
MPLYEYGCRGCGARFETLRKAAQRLAAPPCPDCGAHETSLRLSAPGFVGATSGGGTGAGPAGACGADPGACCGGGLCMN